jgi:hypothetical protein
MMKDLGDPPRLPRAAAVNGAEDGDYTGRDIV